MKKTKSKIKTVSKRKPLQGATRSSIKKAVVKKTPLKIPKHFNKKLQKTKGPRKKRKIIITEEKIKQLLDFKHIEELFYLIHILNHPQVEIFLKHYKESQPRKTIDKKLDAMIRKSETKEELVNLLKRELTASLDLEYRKITQKIAAAEKNGHDPYIEKLKAESIPSRIKLFSSTAAKEDYYRVKKVLLDIENELNSLKREFKKEDKEMEKIDDQIKQLRLKIKEIQNV
jgi:hypothetical protein